MATHLPSSVKSMLRTVLVQPRSPSGFRDNFTIQESTMFNILLLIACITRILLPILSSSTHDHITPVLHNSPPVLHPLTYPFKLLITYKVLYNLGPPICASSSTPTHTLGSAGSSTHLPEGQALLRCCSLRS